LIKELKAISTVAELHKSKKYTVIKTEIKESTLGGK
jgi:hypothetical protein